MELGEVQAVAVLAWGCSQAQAKAQAWEFLVVWESYTLFSFANR